MDDDANAIATLLIPFPGDVPGDRKVAIKTPVEITSFSFDNTHTYRADDSSLRYYYTPEADADLSEGFDTFQKHDDSADEHLDSLLRAIMELEQRQRSKVETDVVTWRGMFTKILVAPYSPDDGFEMNATFFQDTIFIEEHHAHKQARQAAESSRPTHPGQATPALGSFWGYKFETLATLRAPWAECSREEIEARPTEPVANAAQYVAVAASRVGGAAFVLGGEVDAVWDVKRPLATDDGDAPRRTNYVELKTAAMPKHDGQHRRFEARLLKYWAQSFLLGVPKIVVGLRSAGVAPRLLRTEEWATTTIPRWVRERGASWHSAPCLAFLDDWIAWVVDVVARRPGVWRIRLAPGGAGGGARRRVEMVRIADEGTGRILSPEFLAWRGGAAPVEGEPTATEGGRPPTPPSC